MLSTAFEKVVKLRGVLCVVGACFGDGAREREGEEGCYFFVKGLTLLEGLTLGGQRKWTERGSSEAIRK